jgi:hypothetical protein
MCLNQVFPTTLISEEKQKGPVAIVYAGKRNGLMRNKLETKECS